MTVGSILLSGAAIALLLGVGQRVLDKMHLTDRAALIIIAAMFVGGLLPDIDLGLVRINVGGAVIPLGVCVYLLVRAENDERARAVMGVVVTSGILYLLGRIMPDEPEKIWIDPVYLCGIVAGLSGTVFGHSRRGAFISGVTGVLLADVINAIVVWSSGIEQTLRLGGAGIFDTAVISGLSAVLTAELIGEAMERVARMRGVQAESRRVHDPRKGEKHD